jgi:hypothetical protein
MKTAVEWLAEQMLWNEFHNPYLEQAKEMEKEQKGYSEEDMKQFGLYLGDNLKKLKGKSIDELFTNFKQQEQ